MDSVAIESMAKAMGVTQADILSLANMVSKSLTKDGMKDIFIGMSEAQTVSTVCAYVAAEVKKFSWFCMSLLTNTEKKSAFDQYLFYKLKEA